ncbi:hypothetical protein AAG906_026201 [Vitis piasezkii]
MPFLLMLSPFPFHKLLLFPSGTKQCKMNFRLLNRMKLDLSLLSHLVNILWAANGYISSNSELMALLSNTEQVTKCYTQQKAVDYLDTFFLVANNNTKSIEDLKTFLDGFLACKPASTPMEANVKLSQDDGEFLEDLGLYRRLINLVIFKLLIKLLIKFYNISKDRLDRVSTFLHLQQLNSRALSM